MVQKTYFLSKHGCAKNQVDGELLVGALQKSGWTLLDTPEQASVIIVNSCGFIESAKKESLSAVFEAKKNYPNAKIVLAGCLAERYADELSTDLPEVDAFFGNGDVSKITDVFASLFDFEREMPNAHSSFFGTPSCNQYKKKVWLYPQVGVSCGARPKLFNYKASVYIKITEGCSNCCTFCAIPLIRGAVRSRPIKDILAEMQAFIAAGVYEFNLIGQDLAAFSIEAKDSSVRLKQMKNKKLVAYTRPGTHFKNALIASQEKQSEQCQESVNQGEYGDKSLSGLARLLKAISTLQGMFTIRLLYIHPDNFPHDILPIMVCDKRFLPYFDLPFQSADEHILKQMNRRGNRTVYQKLIDDIRNSFEKTAYGTACIRTTFLVGFPGETEGAFNETLLFLKEVRPLWSGVFEYSPEEDTPAFSFPNPVAKRISYARKALLQDTQTQITTAELNKFVGKTFKCLVEEVIENTSDENFFLLARAWFQAPEVDGCVVIPVYDEDMCYKYSEGSLVDVRITAVRNLDLEGTLV